MMLFNYCRKSSCDSYAVAAHYYEPVLLILVLIYRVHSLRILGSQFEDLSHFYAPGMFYRSSAHRTRIVLFEEFKVCNNIALVVSAVVDIFYVIIFFVGSCAKIPETGQLAVNNHLAVVKAYRTRKSSHAACLL